MSIGDQEDEDLKLAMRLSMQQNESPEPKRSKSKDDSGVEGLQEESPEAKSRRIQRELMAAAAEKRMAATSSVDVVKDVDIARPVDEGKGKGKELSSDEGGGKGKELSSDEGGAKDGNPVELPIEEANQLFLMIFGEGVSKDVLAQWCNQGIR